MIRTGKKEGLTHNSFHLKRSAMQFCSLESVFDYRKVNQSVFSNGLLAEKITVKGQKTGRSQNPPIFKGNDKEDCYCHSGNKRIKMHQNQ